MSFALEGRVAVVTGAGGGLGEGECLSLAAAGAAVACVERDEQRLAAVVDKVRAAGGRALGVAADVADRMAAAIYPLRPWTEITEEEWDSVLAVNLKGYFLCARACRDSMAARGFGRIVNLSSITYMIGFKNMLSYVSSKGGVIAFTRALAREVGPDGITVNAIAPGAFPTDAEKIHPNPEQYNQWILEQQSLKRRGTPEDIGNAVVFLGSDAASFITGQTIVVDGGWAMH